MERKLVQPDHFEFRCYEKYFTIIQNTKRRSHRWSGKNFGKMVQGMSKVGAKYIDDKDDKNNNTVPSEGPVPKAYELPTIV